MVIVRYAKKTEFPPLAELVRREIWPEQEVELIERWLDGFGAYPFVHFFVAVDNEEIIGTAIWNVLDLRDGQFSLEISTVAVRAEYRRQGIASDLVRQSLPMIQKAETLCDMTLAVVTVVTEASNEGAVKFYRRFRPFVEQRVPGYWNGEDGDVVVFYLRGENIFA